MTYNLEYPNSTAKIEASCDEDAIAYVKQTNDPDGLPNPQPVTIRTEDGRLVVRVLH